MADRWAVLLGLTIWLTGCGDSEVWECRDRYLASETCTQIGITWERCGSTGIAETGASGEDIEAILDACL